MSVAVALATRAPAADFYIDADAPPGGDGSQAAPFDTISDFTDIVFPGDRALLRGQFAETIEFGNRQNITFEPWPGEDSWTNCAAIEIDAFGDPDGDAYPKSGDQFFPASVAENWSLDDEQPKGHLAQVPSLEECKSTPGSWFVNLTTQQLWVHTSDSSDPRTNGRSYKSFRQGDGMVVIQSDGLVIRGAVFAGWCLDSDFDSIDSSGIFIRTSSNCLIEDCVVIDSAGHSIEFSGSECRGNTVRNCEMRGLRVNGANHLVFFSSEPGGEVEGCLVEDTVAHCYGLLTPSGQSLNGASVIGFFQHSGGDTLITDVEYRRCRAIGYDGHRSSPWDGANQTDVVDAADRFDWSSYPVRFVDCDFVNATNVRLGGDSSIAFSRCSMEFSSTGQFGPGIAAAIEYGPTEEATHRLLLESCEITTDLAPTASRVFSLRGDVELILSNATSFLENGAAPSHFRLHDEFPEIHAMQSVFASAMHVDLIKGSAQDVYDAGGLNFTYCWYDAIEDGDFSPAPAIDEAAEWQTLIDPGAPGVSAMYGESPGFANPPLDMNALPAAPIRALKFEAPGPQPTGLLGVEYMGTFGSRQYPPTADQNGDGRVSAIDLAIVIGAWGVCPDPPDSCPEDLTGDGEVTALDIATLLSFWTG